jgi:predicted phage tail protein
MDEIKELKAAAYDILAQMEYLKQRLNQVNEQIQIKTNEMNKKELQNVTDSE